MSAAGASGQGARRLLFLPAAGGFVLAVAGYFPTRSLAGQTGIPAMLAAQAVVIGVMYLTLVPTWWRMRGAGIQARFRMALKAGVIRLVLTVSVAAVVAWRGGVNPAAFLVWLAIAYVVLIKLETWALIGWSRRLEEER